MGSDPQEAHAFPGQHAKVKLFTAEVTPGT